MSTTFPYLGAPGAMQQFPGPSGGMTREPINAPSPVGNMAGGETVVAPLKTRDRFVLPYTSRPGTGFADLLFMFRDGVFGRGPFVYVDPSVSNVLGLDVSTMGVVDGAHGWVASAGTLAIDATQTSPVLGSAVLKWAAPTTGAALRPGAVAGTADTTTAPVYLAGEPLTVSLYATASAAGAVLRVDSFDGAGALLSNSATTAIGTSWARYSWTVAAGGFAGAAFALPAVRIPATAPANVWIAGAQLEYASGASTWQRGYRSPRVTVTGWPGWASNKWDGYASHSLTLSEAY